MEKKEIPKLHYKTVNEVAERRARLVLEWVTVFVFKF